MSQEFESIKPNKLKRFVIPSVILAGIIAGGVVLSNNKEVNNPTEENPTPVGEIGSGISTTSVESINATAADQTTGIILTEGGMVNSIENSQEQLKDTTNTVITAEEDRQAQIKTGVSMAEYSEYIRKNYPLLAEAQKLNSRLYTAGICDSKKYPNDDMKRALCIYVQDPEISSSYPDNTLDTQGVRDALKNRYSPYVNKQIVKLGYDPSDYEIIYVDDK